MAREPEIRSHKIDHTGKTGQLVEINALVRTSGALAGMLVLLTLCRCEDTNRHTGRLARMPIDATLDVSVHRNQRFCRLCQQ